MKKPYTTPRLRQLGPEDPRVIRMQDELGGLLVETTLPDGSTVMGRVGEKTFEALRAHFAKEKNGRKTP